MTTLRPRLVLWVVGYVDWCDTAKVGVCGASFGILPKVESPPRLIRGRQSLLFSAAYATIEERLTRVRSVYIVNT
jgi:hypothetical protein